MSTLWKKLWCIMLSLALFLSLLPMSVGATETSVEQQAVFDGIEVPNLDTSETEFQQTLTENTEGTQAVIVCEDVTLRDEFVKHFQMSDGSYTATVYNEPVHQLVDGAWVEVDNTLTLSTSAKGVAKYQTVNGLADVSFAQNFGNELVTMEQDEHSITWGVAATIDRMETEAVALAQLTENWREPVVAEILPIDLSAVAAEEQKIFATKATSTIQYADALANGVNLEYTVLPSRIKENIILDCPQNISAYTVTVNTSGLFARLLDTREVEFYTEDGENVFTMWAPYMYDSASELSEDIAVELTELGNGQYAITLTPDASWLNSPDRVYPVVIDPDVSVSRARTNIIDNTVMEGQGNQNRNLDRLYIGRKSGARVRAFLKYDVMPTIPSNATITAATQTLYITSGTDTGSTAGAYIVTGGDWASDTITWDNRPTAATTIQASISHNNFSYYRFSCLSAVHKWYTGSTIGKNANYGITVRYTDETINDYNAFYSADYSVEAGRPQLSINYTTISVDVTKESGYLFVGKTQRATCTTSPSGLSVTWMSSDPDVATVSASGIITGVSEGSAKISAIYYHAETETIYHDYVYVYVYSSYGLEDGTQYYIMNYETKRLLSLQTFADVNNTNVYTRERVNSYSSRWRLKKQSDERFQLENGYSSSGKVLHVTGSNLDLYTNNTSESTKFTIYRLNSDAYSGLYYFRYGSYFVAQDENNNVYLTSSPSNKAIWSFSEIREGYADIFSHDYTYEKDGIIGRFNTAVNNSYFKTVFSTALGYTANASTNSTASYAFSTLAGEDQQIFVFRGHGDAGIISFYKEGSIATGGIYADVALSGSYQSGSDKKYISSLNNNALHSLRCVLCLGCSTGDDIVVTPQGPSYNTVDALYQKGAHFVLGTTETITNTQGNSWLEYWLDNILLGESIKDACINANDDLGYIEINYGTTDAKTVYGMPIYSRGDTIQYLTLP